MGIQMQTNLNTTRLEEIASLAKEVRIWIGDHGHPEHYQFVKDLQLLRDFLHTLDLLETVLMRFEIGTRLAKDALEQIESSTQEGDLGWEFWQIDIEEFFAANLLELCYQISNAWKTLEGFSKKDPALRILRTKHLELGKTILARHKATHFQPEQFESLEIAQQFSILRRPYSIKNGRLEKELAKFTIPKVAALIHEAVDEGYIYLKKFQASTK
jgi:hypothetical protein